MGVTRAWTGSLWYQAEDGIRDIGVTGVQTCALPIFFGIEHLPLAEDVVQEALARALQTWPFYGVPQNPSAWIMRASRNLALDVVRREKVFRSKIGRASCRERV